MTCELCGGERFSTHLAAVRDYISDQTFSILRCDNCSLLVTDPMPADDLIERYYPPRYRTERQKFSAGFRVNRRAHSAEALDRGSRRTVPS